MISERYMLRVESYGELRTLRSAGVEKIASAGLYSRVRLEMLKRVSDEHFTDISYARKEQFVSLFSK
jgi:hypothetical protein